MPLEPVFTLKSSDKPPKNTPCSFLLGYNHEKYRYFSWLVTVKAEGAGDVRFAVQMESDQMSRAVNETESTNQY